MHFFSMNLEGSRGVPEGPWREINIHSYILLPEINFLNRTCMNFYTLTYTPFCMQHEIHYTMHCKLCIRDKSLLYQLLKQPLIAL